MRNIKNYEGFYAITESGEIWSCKHKVRRFKGKAGHFIKPWLNHNGYMVVNLFISGVRKGGRVHRLVAEAFIQNPDNKPQVNHIDGNKLNNNVANLEWCTNEENLRHGFEKGLMKGKILNYSQADEIIEKYKTGVYKQKELALLFGVTVLTINKIINNKWRVAKA